MKKEHVLAGFGITLLLIYVFSSPDSEANTEATGDPNSKNLNKEGTYSKLDKETKSADIYWHSGAITVEERERNMGQKGVTLWFVGMSGSGKSTVAVEVERQLVNLGHHVYRLDGDNMRYGLNSDLGFTDEDRTENIRRVGEVARLFADAGVITIASFISPFAADRAKVRKIHEDANLRFMEVYVSAPLEVLEARDPKGLYKKARAGEIKGFTGIDAPFEAPVNPELELKTDLYEVADCTKQVLDDLRRRTIIP